ncbi:alkaline serine exoprotease A-like [Gigantopelta aegis]|uniref:alkaline serine exoprotease A-like n=1 Tax=Gigantopelta aegis TaxID=1735272 RepID=UPI001B888D57|nr:alkaline serine exoprotease A-like [Gigantopelta aegis]
MALDRIDQVSPVLDGIFEPGGDGEDVDIYILDTGINYDHCEFDSHRAIYTGYDPVDNYYGTNLRGRDCNRHGTHVASLACGKHYGVAKKANFNVVSSNIVNMGIPIVAAAGNNRGNACNYSPASAPGVITVAGSARGDGVYYYTNGGSCVNIFAPGSDVIGADYSCSEYTSVEPPPTLTSSTTFTTSASSAFASSLSGGGIVTPTPTVSQDTSVEPPPTLTSSTTFTTSASSAFASSLSGGIVTPTPTVSQDTSVEPPPILASSTTFPTSASSAFTSSLSGDIVYTYTNYTSVEPPPTLTSSTTFTTSVSSAFASSLSGVIVTPTPTVTQDTSVEPPPTLTSSTIFPTSASFAFASSLSGDIVTPTPIVNQVSGSGSGYSQHLALDLDQDLAQGLE